MHSNSTGHLEIDSECNIILSWPNETCIKFFICRIQEYSVRYLAFFYHVDLICFRLRKILEYLGLRHLAHSPEVKQALQMFLSEGSNFTFYTLENNVWLLVEEHFKATIPGKSGSSAPSNVMLFHCCMHLYWTITNPWTCMRVVPFVCRCMRYKAVLYSLSNEPLHLYHCQHGVRGFYIPTSDRQRGPPWYRTMGLWWF